MVKLISIIFAVLISIAPYQLAAAAEETRPFICAVVEVFECSIVNDCAEVEPESVNLSRFIRIDFENKKLMLPEGSEEERTSVIKNIEHNNGTIILQGAEHGRAWSIAISEENGKMTGTIAEGNGGFVVFGACTLD